MELIQQISNYSKFIKDVLTKRRRVGEFENVALTQECNYMVKGKIPPKLKDFGTLIIHCTITNTYNGIALCDLDTSNNLILLSITSLAQDLQNHNRHFEIS